MKTDCQRKNNWHFREKTISKMAANANVPDSPALSRQDSQETRQTLFQEALEQVARQKVDIEDPVFAAFAEVAKGII